MEEGELELAAVHADAIAAQDRDADDSVTVESAEEDTARRQLRREPRDRGLDRRVVPSGMSRSASTRRNCPSSRT
jgi:hypothetical protein